MPAFPAQDANDGTWGMDLRNFFSPSFDLATSAFNANAIPDTALNIPNIKFMASYADFETAVSTIGATVTTLIVSEVEVVANNVTVPSTLHLDFQGLGELSVNSTFTVTINGPLTAPLRRIITGPGKVIISDESVDFIYPQWWGAKGDNATDNTSAFSAMILAAKDAGGMRMYVPGGLYLVDSIDLSGCTNCEFKGAGHFQTDFIARVGGVNFFTVGPGNVSKLKMSDFSMSDNGNIFSGHAMAIELLADGLVERLNFSGFVDQLSIKSTILTEFNGLGHGAFTGIAVELIEGTGINSVTFRGGRLTGISGGAVLAGTVGVKAQSNSALFIGYDIEAVDVGIQANGPGVRFEGVHSELTNIFAEIGVSAGASLEVLGGFISVRGTATGFAPTDIFKHVGPSITSTLIVEGVTLNIDVTGNKPSLSIANVKPYKGSWRNNVIVDVGGNNFSSDVGVIVSNSSALNLWGFYVEDGNYSWSDNRHFKRVGQIASIATISPGTKIFKMPSNGVAIEVMAVQGNNVEKYLVKVSTANAVTQQIISTLGTTIATTFEWDNASKELRAFATASTTYDFSASGVYSLDPPILVPENAF